MNILIFEDNLNGHRLEYIHHIYELATHDSEHNYFFVLADSFIEVSALFQWVKANNITIELFKSNEGHSLGKRETLFEIKKRSQNYALLINHYISKYNIHRIFAITIILYIPFLFRYLPNSITIDGILYSIFPSEKRGFPFRYIDYLKYAIFSFSSRFSTIYVLNDKDNTMRLNKIFYTQKFKFIPDPFSLIDTSLSKDLHFSLKIKSGNTVFLHFGGLQKRKGTMLIMESIKMLTEEERSRYTFIFAGKVYDDIKDDFYYAYNELKHQLQIIVKDEFCSYEYLASLCKTCDCILIPYLSTMQSSGLIGYASQFKKPVISPSVGLIGQLVKNYSLGYRLPNTNALELIKAYRLIAHGEVPSPTDMYCQFNNIYNFQKTISLGFQNL